MPATLPSPIPYELADLIAQRMRVIGDPMRIRIIDLLRNDEHSVQELTDALCTSQQNTSKHLGVLLRAGIVGRRKQGTSSIYRVVDHGVYDLCEQICGALQNQLDDIAKLMEGGK